MCRRLCIFIPSTFWFVRQRIRRPERMIKSSCHTDEARRSQGRKYLKVLGFFFMQSISTCQAAADSVFQLFQIKLALKRNASAALCLVKRVPNPPPLCHHCNSARCYSRDLGDLHVSVWLLAHACSPASSSPR